MFDGLRSSEKEVAGLRLGRSTADTTVTSYAENGTLRWPVAFTLSIERKWVASSLMVLR